MIIEIKEQDGGMKAILNGRLDTPAAVKAQQEIGPLLENADKEIVFDCTNLEYISSSGLRLFLTIRKEASVKGGKVVIENINDEIRKVFMMTGFFNLFEIRNAKKQKRKTQNSNHRPQHPLGVGVKADITECSAHYDG